MGNAAAKTRANAPTDGRAGACQIGTSGWNYRHWSGGRFYPPRLPASRWLQYYAGHFHTVEVNSTFYNIPSAQTVRKWSHGVPAGFTFALKLWRGITHYRKLHNCREFLERFFTVASELAPVRRAPLLVQLPPSFQKDLGRLEAFLDELRSVLHGARWQVAVEFRHASWLDDGVYRLLEQRRVNVALSDHGRCTVEQTNDTHFVYVRRHGKNYSGSYTSEQIAADARRIQAWCEAGKMVCVYYNNDVGGHAVDNARELMAKLGVAPPAVDEEQQGEFSFR